MRTRLIRLDWNTITADEKAASAEALADAFENVTCDDKEVDAVES